MPRVGTVEGIAIYIYAGDHPPPHFHAIAGERSAVFNIADLSLLVASTLTSPEERAVRAWAGGRRDALLAKFNELNPPRP